MRDRPPDTSVPLHRPWIGDAERQALARVLARGELAGNGEECRELESELGRRLAVSHALAVSSATHALEIAMHLLDLAGGEVVLPSFTFPSVGNAVVRAGGRPVFCEVREPDLNIDLDHALSLVGPRTRALVVTHYAGHPVDPAASPVPVVEDAAHALGSRLGGRSCGTLGRFGCLSFHATKNVVAGEGGALLVSDPGAARAARIFREKGTNRDEFLAGEVAFYSWVGLGSSLVLPELGAALARAQLARLDDITRRRRAVAARYEAGLGELERRGELRVVRCVEGESCHHVFAVLVAPERRARLLARLRQLGVGAASHFVPLHASPFGRAVGRAPALPRTERLAASLVRLPIFPTLAEAEQERVIDAVESACRTS
ncbi:MAG TPA: DegT/DnrJ/EryC1/StrS family aminotransferase [Thermoanaerobaculia bacterium]